MPFNLSEKDIPRFANKKKENPLVGAYGNDHKQFVTENLGRTFIGAKKLK